MVVLVAKLCPTPWIVTCHAPLSTGFPRQKYWSGLPFHFPGDLPDPGIKSNSCIGGFFTTEPPGRPGHKNTSYFKGTLRSV